MITGTLADRVAMLMPQVKTELAELVAMRSVADPRQFPPEGAGTGGLEAIVPPNADLLRADVILLCDTGN